MSKNRTMFKLSYYVFGFENKYCCLFLINKGTLLYDQPSYVRLKKHLVNAAYENNCLYSDNHKQHINALSGCNAKSLDIKTCVVYSYSCTSNCSVCRSN